MFVSCLVLCREQKGKKHEREEKVQDEGQREQKMQAMQIRMNLNAIL